MSNITQQYPKSTRSHTKGAASRSRLLRSAARAFAAQGFYATKVSDIVGGAGLTQPAFYLYFESKDAIFAELTTSFRRRLEQLVKVVRPFDVSEPAVLVNHVRSNLEAVYSLLADDLQLTQIMLLSDPDTDAFSTALISLMHNQLVQAQAAGLVRRSLDLDVVAHALVGMVQNLAKRWLLSGEKDAKTLAAIHADMVLNGVLQS